MTQQRSGTNLNSRSTVEIIIPASLLVQEDILIDVAISKRASKSPKLDALFVYFYCYGNKLTKDNCAFEKKLSTLANLERNIKPRITCQRFPNLLIPLL